MSNEEYLISFHNFVINTDLFVYISRIYWLLLKILNRTSSYFRILALNKLVLSNKAAYYAFVYILTVDMVKTIFYVSYREYLIYFHIIL